MITAIESLVEGQTEEIVQQLRTEVGGVISNVNLTLCALTLIIHDTLGNLVILDATKYGVRDATTGKVFVKGNVAVFKSANAPYRVHWEVIDGAGNVSFFPKGAYQLWDVYGQ